MQTVLKNLNAPTLRTLFTFALSLLMVIALQISVADYTDAKKKRKRYKRTKVSKKVRGNPRYAAYVIDAKTGKVLHAEKANALRYPASLTKMMTVYLMFEDLKSGRIKLTDRVVMTKAGARRPPSKLGLRPGKSISVKQAILSLVTKSANDVATAVGDKLSGSEKKFAQRMTLKARQLGMSRTTFKNANGLTAKGQLTTAADMAKLGLALREHFPRRYRYFKTRNFKLGRRNYRNHNRLLGRVRGVDGIKTGYTRASGFNLVSSVSSGKRRIVAVVMGGRSGRTRNAAMARLISKYLPKASRGTQQRLISRAQPSRQRSGSLQVSGIASPEIAKKASKRITQRLARGNTVPTKQEVKKVNNQIASMSASSRPTPKLRAQTDKVTTAGIQNKASTGKIWQIQIAASDKQHKAMNMLTKAKASNKGLLDGTTPITQKITKDGVTLYRARLVGFRSKVAANFACKQLKKQNYACLALPKSKVF